MGALLDLARAAAAAFNSTHKHPAEEMSPPLSDHAGVTADVAPAKQAKVAKIRKARGQRPVATVSATAPDRDIVGDGGATPEVPGLPAAVLLTKDFLLVRVRLACPAPLFRTLMQVFSEDRARALYEFTHRWSAVLGRLELDIRGGTGDPINVPMAGYLGEEADFVWLHLASPTPLFNSVIKACHDDSAHALLELTNYWTAMLRRLAPDACNGTLREFITTQGRDRPS